MTMGWDETKMGGFRSVIHKLSVNYMDVFTDNALIKKNVNYTMVVAVSTICPPDGF